MPMPDHKRNRNGIRNRETDNKEKQIEKQKMKACVDHPYRLCFMNKYMDFILRISLTAGLR